jgi:hypothetical protein
MRACWGPCRSRRQPTCQLRRAVLVARPGLLPNGQWLHCVPRRSGMRSRLRLAVRQQRLLCAVSPPEHNCQPYACPPPCRQTRSTLHLISSIVTCHYACRARAASSLALQHAPCSAAQCIVRKMYIYRMCRLPVSIRLSAQARMARSAFAGASAARPHATTPVTSMGSGVSSARTVDWRTPEPSSADAQCTSIYPGRQSGASLRSTYTWWPRTDNSVCHQACRLPNTQTTF